MAYWSKILFTIPKSPVLVIVVTRRLNDSLVMLSIDRAMLVVTRFSFYFGNSAILNKTS